MTVVFRSLVTPGVAVAVTGIVTLGPAMAAPPALTGAAAAVAAPTVRVDNIALAGIGRDLYNAVTPSVQYGVSLTQYAVGFVPYIGPPIADQIGINYFNLVQPLIANTVYVLSDIVSDPFNLPGWINSYLINQAYVGLGYLNAQAAFFGAPPFPPIPFPPAPPLATTSATASAGAGSRSAIPGSAPAQRVTAPGAAAAVAPAEPAAASDQAPASRRPGRDGADRHVGAPPQRAAAGAASVTRGAASVARGAARTAARSVAGAAAAVS
jgi:hypothetical protein